MSDTNYGRRSRNQLKNEPKSEKRNIKEDKNKILYTILGEKEENKRSKGIKR